MNEEEFDWPAIWERMRALYESCSPQELVEELQTWKRYAARDSARLRDENLKVENWLLMRELVANAHARIELMLTVMDERKLTK